jgi:hypothetical protein
MDSHRDVLEALADKARTHSGGLGHMLHRLCAGPFAEGFAQASRRALASSAGTIRFRKVCATHKAVEAAFVHDEDHPMLSQGEIALLSPARIMNLHAAVLASWAGRLAAGRYRFDPNETCG